MAEENVAVAVTAFRPFRPTSTGGRLRWEYNTSELLLRAALEGEGAAEWKAELEREGIRVLFSPEEDLLDVTYAATERASKRLLKKAKEGLVDAILHFGQHSVKDAILIERRARNWNGAHTDMSDALGIKEDIIYQNECLEHKIVEGLEKDSVLLNTLPVDQLLSIEGTRPSDDAGTYLCNNIFFKTLHGLGDEREAIPSGFIHVPIPHDSQATLEEGEEWIRGESGRFFISVVRRIIHETGRTAKERKKLKEVKKFR